MKIELPYGRSSIYVHLPDESFRGLLEPSNSGGLTGDASSHIRFAAENPAGPQRFSEFLALPGSLLVIVNDATRPTPTAGLIAVFAEQLDAVGAEFLIATGAHRGPDRAELEYIFGGNLARFRERIHIHDARDGDFDYYGTTSRGTEVRLNRLVGRAGRILIIGSVEPHYFAGFTGGRKGLLPGVAAYESIEQNHSLALSSDAAPMKLFGNPVHEDLAEAARFVDKKIFSIMAVLDRSQDIFAVTAGGLEQAFKAAAETATGVFSAFFDEPADVVIACAKYPMDIDLYQSQKALEHARLAMKPGGSLVLVSSCRDGIGDSTFLGLLSSCAGPKDVFKKIEKGYRLGFHKAARMADLCTTSTVLAYTGLEAGVLESVFIKPVDDLQAVLDGLLLNTVRTVLVIPDASVTVPVASDPGR